MQPHVLTRDEVVHAPLDIELGALDAFEPMAAFASFDGSAAASAYRPCITYYTQDGKVFARAFPADDVAAGASADVSWFPGLAVAASPASTNPVVSNQLDYVEITASVTITNVNTFANQKTVITSSALAFDGATRVRVEVYSPVFDVEGINNILLDLWDNTTDLGRWGQLDLDPNPADIGTPMYLVHYITPSAGTHTFRAKAWTSGVAGSGSVGAGAGGVGGGGNPNYMPAWMRISV